MAKSTNKWAIILWVTAGLFALGQAGEIVTFNWSTNHQLWMSVIWTVTRAVFFNVGTLAGLGILIEMTDQIRWQLRSLAERVKTVENSN